MREPLRRLVRGLLQAIYRVTGVQIYRDENRFYSPLPTYAELAAERERWDRPSGLVGLDYDLDQMRDLLDRLVSRYGEEVMGLETYDAVKKLGLGEGFAIVDAPLLYFMLRDLKPRRYIEIGAGFCTYFSHAALERNRAEGHPCVHQVVEPHPRQALRDLAGDDLVVSPAQHLPLEFFERLAGGDVLFIDTTHVVKVGGEVPFLYLEVVPRLQPGVVVHAHDIRFPYNTPYPAARYVFGRLFPWVWTEAMLLQAFLAFNDDFEIVLCPSLVAHDDRDRGVDSLARIPGYRPFCLEVEDTHCGSLWFRRAG